MQDLALSQRGLTPLQDLLRLLSGGLIAVVVTFCLYWLMASLVAAGREALTDAPDGKLVDFVRLKREQNLEVERPKPEKPDKPEAPPPDAPVPQTELDAPTRRHMAECDDCRSHRRVQEKLVALVRRISSESGYTVETWCAVVDLKGVRVSKASNSKFRGGQRDFIVRRHFPRRRRHHHQ